MNIELRDYFAGLAMQKLINEPLEYGHQIESLCEEAYDLADAMLEARELK